MSVYEISNNRLIRAGQTNQTLREGQIVQGKILKLYKGIKLTYK